MPIFEKTIKLKKMIKLDDNYKIDVDTTHGLILKFEGEEKEISYKDKEGVEKTKLKAPTDAWFFPSLGMTLKRYCQESKKSVSNLEELLVLLEKIDSNISDLNRVYAKGGEIFTTK